MARRKIEPKHRLSVKQIQQFITELGQLSHFTFSNAEEQYLEAAYVAKGRLSSKQQKVIYDLYAKYINNSCQSAYLVKGQVVKYLQRPDN